MAELSSLPPELLISITTYLPLHSLHAFALTSRLHHALTGSSLRSLSLSITPAKTSSTLSNPLSQRPRPPQALSSNSHAFSHPQSTTDQTINLTLPKPHSRSKTAIIRAQAKHTSSILLTYGRALHTLDLGLWQLTPSTARAIARCSRLKNLSVRLDHPLVRHRDVRAGYWRKAEGGEAGGVCWNELFSMPVERARSGKGAEEEDVDSGYESASARSEGSGVSRSSSPSSSSAPRSLFSSSDTTNATDTTDATNTSDSPSPAPHPAPVLGSLLSLTLTRAGLTTWQLTQLLRENPSLAHLTLRKCSLLTPEFFTFLAHSHFAQTLKTLVFEDVDSPGIDARILPDLRMLEGLEVLSLSECVRMGNEGVRLAREEGAWGKLREVGWPVVEPGEGGEVEVDPAYT